MGWFDVRTPGHVVLIGRLFKRNFRLDSPSAGNGHWVVAIIDFFSGLDRLTEFTRDKPRPQELNPGL